MSPYKVQGGMPMTKAMGIDNDQSSQRQANVITQNSLKPQKLYQNLNTTR